MTLRGQSGQGSTSELLNFVGVVETEELSEASWTAKFPREWLKAADALQLHQRNRMDRTAKVVTGSSANRTLFHMSDQAELRQAFAGRDEGSGRNGWLYNYNPLTVALA